MNVITVAPSGQSIIVSEDSTNGIVTLTSLTNNTSSIITVNQGQQGPAGVSVIVSNYGNNRIPTSDGTAGGLYAESDLTFDGNKLRVSGIEVSLSGHTHLASDITNLNTYITSGINTYFSGLSTIGNNCDTEYLLVQNASKSTSLISISGIADAISIIDGGGVSYSGC
jgi:hypothetical protein